MLGRALLQPVGMVHVHVHEHSGRPAFSFVDRREQRQFVPDFFKVRREIPHGAIVLSHDRAIGSLWLDPDTIVSISEFNSVGPHTTVDAVPSERHVDFIA
jgi:hypothetical protein